MSRVQLFEFEDLSWFPEKIRNYMTDYLEFVSNKYDIYEPVVPILLKGLKSTSEPQIVDLASGGGGGWKSLSKHLKVKATNIHVHLTDFYPNQESLENFTKVDPSFFSYSTDSVDARNVPANLKGLRTQFLSFHHFNEEDAKSILQNAIDSGNPIAVFEAQKNSVGDFIKLFFSPINVLLFTPLIKPFTFGRLFFTYIIPLVPIFTWWDGLVSVLRSYSPKELNKLIDELENKDKFLWEIGEKKKGMFTIYYLLGTPVNQS